MSVDSARARFERSQTNLFRDMAVVERPAANSSLNSTTGDLDPDAPTQLYSGACLIRSFVWEGTNVQAGGEEVRLARVRCKFPKDTPGTRNDIIRPTASTYDSALVGKSYRITDAFEDGWQICRVFIAEEVT